MHSQVLFKYALCKAQQKSNLNFKFNANYQICDITFKSKPNTVLDESLTLITTKLQEIRINMHDQKGGGVRIGGGMGPKGILMGGDRSLGRDGLPPLSHQASTMQLLPHHSMSNLQGTGNGPGQQGQHAQYGPPHNHIQNQQYQQRDQQFREMQQPMMQQKHQRQQSSRNRGGSGGDHMGNSLLVLSD